MVGLLAAGKRISAAHPPCKSELMLLCEKFQARFSAPAVNGSSLILLNEAAIELSVPRRRLYDIINVLEAVEIVSRTGKLAYEWRGLKHLPELLDRLVADQVGVLPWTDMPTGMYRPVVAGTHCIHKFAFKCQVMSASCTSAISTQAACSQSTLPYQS